jgi:hypothetical protein
LKNNLNKTNMGKANNGILGAVSGKVGNLIFYIHAGEACVRTAGKRRAALTAAESINTEKFALLMKLFRSMKPFLKLGFSSPDHNSKQNYHNRATSFNSKHAIEVVNGRPEIVFERLLLSQGTGLKASGAEVRLVEGSLQFNWSYNAVADWAAGQDQVMLMAYFPEADFAIYELAGPKRTACVASLEISPSLFTQRMELYIAFASWDREHIADSVYLGRIN